jgi:myosin heavy subunit
VDPYRLTRELLFEALLPATYSRHKVRDAAVLQPQRMWRGYRQRKAYVAYCLHLLSLAEAEAERLKQQRRHGAAVVVQAAARGYLQRRWVAALKVRMAACPQSSATVIQKHVRGYLARKHFRQHRAAMLAAAQEEFIRRVLAATLLQATWRGHRDRRSYCRHRLQMLELAQSTAAAIRLQSVWRGRAVRIAVKQERRRLVLFAQQEIARLDQERLLALVQSEMAMRELRANVERSAATRIQAQWRGHDARRDFSMLLEQNEAFEATQRRLAAVRIQSVWRGCAVKKSVAQHKNVMLQAAMNEAKRLELEKARASPGRLQSAWRGTNHRRQMGKFVETME